MIGAIHRFHGRNSLRQVYKHGQSVRAGQMSLRYLQTERAQGFRAAVVVSRKVHKSAVKRNRIRRRLYGLLGEYDPGAYDLVFTVFDSHLADMPADELRSVVMMLLKKSGALRAVAGKGRHAIVKPVSKEG